MDDFDEESRIMRSNSTQFVLAANGNWRQSLHRHSENARTFWYVHQNRILLVISLISFLMALTALLQSPSCGCRDEPSPSKLEAVPSSRHYPTMPPTETPPSTTMPPTVPAVWRACDVSWTLFGWKCYKLVFGNTFAAGLQSCQSVSGTVASVHSKDENNFIAKLANDTLGKLEPFYIGLQRTSGVWQWVDGSVADFMHWAKGEPNGHNYGQHCAEVWGPDADHGWNDVPCSARLPIVCQKKAAIVSVPQPE
ncbi:C-type lectin 13 [Aphelenchoides avenae]|nr:C-type lectin 13 [Aphelenchus avenae]